MTVDADAEDRITEETTDGFLVGVEGELSVMQDGIIEDNPVVGVYYLGPGVGLRGEIREPTLYEVETLRSITVERSRALYCQGSRDEGPESDRGST
ncbi:hypothetical protein C475_15443 [Halosimplex carlsbadense 2-9-1]|uniref:Uncharacterized protein n=1 Tax=Halosimplex carlsbadense 2-9-1 TaxID=797114 RepID=M0CM24_9EURY|nr:hypothetical protein [Halosimplex carlsbadense]ELZ23678.1 hypothetical protein C475_15443 [Halosimplex carlsbadense 2-9-1]